MLRKNDLFVDTSGWACYLCPEEDLYTEVNKLVRQARKKRGRLVTTNYVMSELVALLSSRYRFSRKQVVALVEKVKTDPSLEMIYVDQTLDDDAWKLLKARLDKEWSLVDVSSFVLMRRFGITHALTTDHHFEQAGFERVPQP